MRQWLLGCGMVVGLGAGATPTAPPMLPAPADAAAVITNTEPPIGVLITDWAEPEGFDPTYRRQVGSRTYGVRTEYPGQPCTQNHVGQFPFRATMGMLPFALTFPVEGLEGAYDSIGFYRLSEDGSRYISVFDPSVSYAVGDVPADLVKPAVDSTSRPQRSLWGVDPRNGTDYFARLVQIGLPSRGSGPNAYAFPNGIRDLDEVVYMSGLSDMHVLYSDLTPRLSRTMEQVMSVTRGTLQSLFGADRVDVRFGGYSRTPGWMELEEDVALAMATDGIRKLVVTRETTDNNNYANNFMSLGYIEAALCRAGLVDEFGFQQVRQVGRTPEYNTALMHNLGKHLGRLAAGADVTVIYTTYGLPWPGNAASGPFSAAHPWVNEVFHENAYNNYLSFKRYAEDRYGDRYNLNFNYADKQGDKRVDNYFAYAMYRPPVGNPESLEDYFPTLRENIDRAKTEGRGEVIVLLSHWYDNNRDTLLAVRVLQGLPLNSRRDLGHGKYWIAWCEVADSQDFVPCDDEERALSRIQYTEAFDAVADTFALGYAHRIRGGVERFGVLPKGIEPLATGPVGRERGGVVRAGDGYAAGASLMVYPDRYPGAPESYTPESFRTINDAADNAVGAWDDFDAYIARPPAMAMHDLGFNSASDPVLFGPYRTLFNQPVSITLTAHPGADLIQARPYIFNEATRGWDPVYRVPGGRGVRSNALGNTVSFDAQILGIFMLGTVAK
jgi:hypothetical protein